MRSGVRVLQIYLRVKGKADRTLEGSLVSCSFRPDIVQIGAGQEGRAVVGLLDDRGLETATISKDKPTKDDPDPKQYIQFVVKWGENASTEGKDMFTLRRVYLDEIESRVSVAECVLPSARFHV